MDILILLAKIAFFGFIVIAGALIAWEILGFLFFMLPLAVGIPIGVYLWNSGHDNVAVVFLLVVLVAQFAWFSYREGKQPASSGSSFDPMSGKTKVYDRDGNIKGYVDND